MKKALYRKRICAEKEKLTPEKVFHTPQYRDLLTSIGHEITGGKLTTLRLYDDKNSGIAGWNQGETVAVNLGNQITSSFLTLELKSDSLIGILGHECGHYRYTDSALRKRYAEHMLNGSWYPKEPVPENAQEKEALDAMNVYFERKDKAILSIFLQTASYLSNLLNDMYIEEKMCALFPGSIRRGILMNRDRNVEWLPTLREMLETEKDRLSILMNLCAQYALKTIRMYQSRSVFIRHRIRYWNLIAFCGWQNQRISGIFTKTLPAIIPGSGPLWLTTAKKAASAFMQI